MAVPDFQTMMLPILTFINSKKDCSSKDIFVFIEKHFNLTQIDIDEMVSSGTRRYISNAQWVITYFRKALLIESTKRGVYSITTRGKNLLNLKPEKIDTKTLRQYPEFVAFTLPANKEIAESTQEAQQQDTPEEIISTNFQIINLSLASQLLDTIKTCSPSFFEKLVVDLLTAMGYGKSIGESKVVGKSGDGGIDGIINEDKLGLESVYIQAKRWQGNVSDVEIRNFIGSLNLKGARKGVFITTSDFTKQAKDSAAMITGIKIVLIDGLTLADLMIEYNVGVSIKTKYEIKRIDSDYFEE